MQSRITPTQREYEARLREGNLVPLACDVTADLETPISAFLKIRDLPHAFLLESVTGGEHVSRYSFLGGRPRAVLTAAAAGAGAGVEVRENGRVERRAGPPLDVAREVLARYRVVPDPELPRFAGGLVGYFGYDLVRGWESLPGRPADDVGSPQMELALADTVLVFDHVKHRIRVVANAFAGDGARAGYQDAVERIDEMRGRLARPVPEQPDAACGAERAVPNMSPDQFLAKVERTKAYIRAGDIFQAIVSQRFAAPIGDLDPFAIYRALRIVNPSPYMFFLDYGGAVVAGSSPELLVRLEGDLVEMRPIAGTRRRGETDDADAALARELLADEKERAEHVMLVDLTRNDIGRIARYGTVEVTELMAVERYSHVQHLVSSVRGRLAARRDALDVLQAVFPHGTVSGAPKVRAMEIIDELEPAARGIYAGAAGYVGFTGTMDTAIAIRTLIAKDGVAYVQAGAGIVADSVPEREYEETVSKASAVLRAIEVAGQHS